MDSTGTVTRSYLWGPLGLFFDWQTGTVGHFYGCDPAGNVRTCTTPNGLRFTTNRGAWNYTAYGAPYGGFHVFGPFGYHGRQGCYTDYETGLILCGARYYCPALGCFISRDLSGFAGGTNLYGYCGGDPVNYSDPAGLNGDNSGESQPPSPSQATGEGYGDPGDPAHPKDHYAQMMGQVDPGTGEIIWGGGSSGSSEGGSSSTAGGSTGGGGVVEEVGDTSPSQAASNSPAAAGAANSASNCRSFPSTAEEMDKMMGFEGERKPDLNLQTGEPYPGRSRVDWEIDTPGGTMRITREKHPYHTTAPDWHRDWHWHVHWPGLPKKPHVRYLPGEPFPGDVVDGS